MWCVDIHPQGDMVLSGSEDKVRAPLMTSCSHAFCHVDTLAPVLESLCRLHFLVVRHSKKGHSESIDAQLLIAHTIVAVFVRNTSSLDKTTSRASSNLNTQMMRFLIVFTRLYRILPFHGLSLTPFHLSVWCSLSLSLFFFSYSWQGCGMWRRVVALIFSRGIKALSGH